MKSFLLRFKGTIFASAQIQEMTSKWVGKKIMWSTFTGRLTEFELKKPPWDFHGLKNTCSFTCKPTTKSIESCVYFTDFFWISIFNTCSYGELFTGVSPTVFGSRLHVMAAHWWYWSVFIKEEIRHWRFRMETSTPSCSWKFWNTSTFHTKEELMDTTFGCKTTTFAHIWLLQWKNSLKHMGRCGYHDPLSP